MIKSLPLKFKFGYLLIINLLIAFTAAAQQPVIATHPRLFIDADAKARMMAKKAANDADWKAVFAQANKYTTGTVIPWNDVSVSDAQYYGTNDIFYSYCGSS